MDTKLLLLKPSKAHTLKFVGFLSVLALAAESYATHGSWKLAAATVIASVVSGNVVGSRDNQ